MLMNKRRLHHVWTKLRAVSYWYFLIGFVIFALIFIVSYRQNNLEMIRLRDAVFVADETDGDIEGALRALRGHVYAHMNTRLASGHTAIKPPIQLKHEYERLVAAEKARVEQVNRSLRSEAEATCLQRFPNTANATGVQPCVQGILDERGAKAREIPKELYQFDFVSPTWTPDLAGISLLLAIACALLFVVRFSLERWLRRELREHA